jgi:hypothetical protein
VLARFGPPAPRGSRRSGQVLIASPLVDELYAERRAERLFQQALGMSW